MKWTHKDISSLYRRKTQAPPERPECPPASRLETTARGETSTAERRLVAEHMAHCSTCADIYLTAKRSPATATPAPKTTSATATHFRHRVFQLAAVLTLCAGPAWWWLSQRDAPRTDIARGKAPAVAHTSIEPAAGARLNAPPSHLRWPPRKGASHHVVVFDEELGRLWRSPESPESEVELPESLQHRMTPGSTFYWRVITRSGIQRDESPLHPFQIMAPKSL